MRKSWRILFPALVLALASCSGSPPPVTTASVSPPEPRVSLQDLLGKSRSELAAQCSEWQEKILVQQKAHKDGQLPYGLLRDLRLPFVMPGLREAKFSPQLGFSLPPYAAEGVKDAELALLYARHGDGEAARKLVDPGDVETLRRIDGYALSRNYPIEWTRLVGLLLHHAEIGIACNDQDAADDLIAWHQELAKLLDDRAKQSPLATALLARRPRGFDPCGQSLEERKSNSDCGPRE